MITLVSSPKQLLPKHMQHSVLPGTFLHTYLLTLNYLYLSSDINVCSIEIRSFLTDKSFFVKPFHPKAPWANQKLNSRGLSYKIRCHDGSDETHTRSNKNKYQQRWNHSIFKKILVLTYVSKPYLNYKANAVHLQDNKLLKFNSHSQIN